MIIRVEILDKKTGKTIIVERQGGNRVATLFSFMQAARKYANKDHKVIRLLTDDTTTLTEFSARYPAMSVEFLSKE